MFEAQVDAQVPSVTRYLFVGHDKHLGVLLSQSWQTAFVEQSTTVPKKWFSMILGMTILVSPLSL